MQRHLKYFIQAIVLAPALLPFSAQATESDGVLSLGGFVESYAVYSQQDETAGSLRNLDFRKYTELHVSGEQAISDSTRAGLRIELSTDREDVGDSIQESFLFVEGAAGRVIIGEEDGAAFLLQVEPPAADELVDGVRPHISAFGAATGGGLNYAHDDFGYAHKVTYLSPAFTGIQAGFSYIPSGNAPDSNGWTPSLADDNAGPRFENGWEAALRYEGELHGTEVTAGTGYSNAQPEDPTGAYDQRQTWNAAFTIGYAGARAGAAYLRSNDGMSDTDTIVAGAGYERGPATIGTSYLRRTRRIADEEIIQRWTTGGTYEWAPGMTLRGAVQMQMAEDTSTPPVDGEGTQVMVGTKVEF